MAILETGRPPDAWLALPLVSYFVLVLSGAVLVSFPVPSVSFVLPAVVSPPPLRLDEYDTVLNYDSVGVVFPVTLPDDGNNIGPLLRHWEKGEWRRKERVERCLHLMDSC